MNAIISRRIFTVLVFSLCAFSPIVQAKQPGTIKQNTSVTIGSESVSLMAGQSVTVEFIYGDQATISFNRADGSLAMVQVPANAVDITVAPTSPVTTPTPTTAQTNTAQTNSALAPVLPTTNAISLPVIPKDQPTSTVQPVNSAPTAPPDETDPFASAGTLTSTNAPTPIVKKDWQAGWQSVQFGSLPAPEEKGPEWLDGHPDPKQCHYMLYLPKGYSKDNTYSVLIWFDGSQNGRLPEDYNDLLDRNNLVVIAPQNITGKNWYSVVQGYISQGMAGEKALSRKVKIDPDKIFVGGFSDGAYAAVIGAFSYPKTLHGVLAWGGGRMVDGSTAKEDPGRYWPGYCQFLGVTRPSDESIAKAKGHIHFAFMIGTLDPELPMVRDVVEAHRDLAYRTQVFIQPNLQHEVGSPDIMQQGLDYIQN